LKSIAKQQLTSLNAKGAYYTYIGVGFLPNDHQFLPPSPSFKTFVTQLPFLDRALMHIAPSDICITASSLLAFLLDPIKEYIRSNQVQIDLHIPTSSYVVQLDEGNTSAQDNMEVDSSDMHDEQAVVATAMENVPFDVRSWLPVPEDVDVWDEYETTVANMCLDAVSVSMDLENENMDVDMDIADPQMGDEDVRDMAVDVAEQEVDELDADVLDEIPGDDMGAVEALEEEEDDGTWWCKHSLLWCKHCLYQYMFPFGQLFRVGLEVPVVKVSYFYYLPSNSNLIF
jgi:hypothetical protein